MQTALCIHEVAARDGLQNESIVLSTASKLQLLELLAAAHPDSLEVTSFVRPDRVPQLADADTLCAALQDAPWRADCTLVGLVLNMRGYERFRSSGLDAMTAVLGADEAFSWANAGMGIARAIAVQQELATAAHADGFPMRLYLSMAFGSPQEGVVDPAVVLDLVTAAKAMAVERVLLSDTTGVAQPKQVEAMLQAALAILPVEQLGLHMHDTHGRALENCAVAMEMGVRHFDASTGGTGGCPFAPGAAGNLATGALLSYASKQGMQPKMDLAAVDAAAVFLAGELGRPLALGALRGAS